MKINFKMMVLAVACAGVFASCNPDEKKVNNSKWVNDNLVGLTYDDENGLDLTYSGETMLGKIAEVKSCDDKNITIAVSGADYEIDALLEEAGDDVIKIATTGLFPGEKVATLSVPYTKDGDEISLNGTVSTDNYTCSVAGTLTTEGLSLAVSNVVIAANEPLAGKKFNIVCYDENANLGEDPTTEDKDAAYPFHLVWEPSTDSLAIMGGFIKMPMEDVLDMAMVLPMIPVGAEGQISVMEALEETLKSVEFKADGNIVASIKDEPVAEAPEQVTPLNFATYKVLNDHQLALYLNLAAIDSAAAEASTKADEEEDPVSNGLIKVLAAVPVLMDAYLPMLGDGIVLNYGTSDKGITSFYLPTEFFAPLADVVGQLLADEDVVALINYILNSIEDETGMMGMLPEIIAQLPALIESCTCFEVGVNFKAE